MPIRRIVPVLSLSCLLAFGVTGCGGGTSSAQAGEALPATPEATVAAMLELARDGRWAEYVDTYYGEQEKFRPEMDDRMALIARLALQRTEIVEGLERVLWAHAEISADGSRAVFDMGGGENLTLHWDGKGWKFHL